MGIEHQGDANDQVEGPGSGHSSDTFELEQPDLADIQQLNNPGESGSEASRLLGSTNLEIVDGSSEPVQLAMASTERLTGRVSEDRIEGGQGNDRIQGGNERFEYPQRTEPGVNDRPDGSRITYERVDGKIVPTQIRYKNGVTTDFGYKDGEMVSVKNSAGGRVFQELELKDADKGKWHDKTADKDLTDVKIKVDNNGIETDWKDEDGKEHKLRVNRDASTILSTKQGDGQFKPTMVVNSEIINACTTFEYDDDGNMIRVNNHQGLDENGQPNDPVQQYESTDGGKTFRLKIAPPGSPAWKVMTEVSVDKDGTFRATGGTGQKMEWKANKRIPTFK